MVRRLRHAVVGRRSVPPLALERGGRIGGVGVDLGGRRVVAVSAVHARRLPSLRRVHCEQALSLLYSRYSVSLSLYSAICSPIHRGRRAGDDFNGMAMGLWWARAGCLLESPATSTVPFTHNPNQLVRDALQHRPPRHRLEMEAVVNGITRRRRCGCTQG